MSFVAKYHQDCAECGQDVEGSDCTYDADDDIVHVRCLAAALSQANSAVKPQELACKHCFTIHVGECP